MSSSDAIIRVTCPKCSKRYRIQRRHAGRHLRCRTPGCEGHFQVPMPDSETALLPALGRTPVARPVEPPTAAVADDPPVLGPDWPQPEELAEPVPPTPQGWLADRHAYNSAAGLPSARTIGLTALIVLALSFLGFLTSLFLAVLVVANAETDKRNAAVMTGATVVAGPFVALVLTVFWAGLIGTLLRIEDRLTEIAEGRNTLSD